MSTTPPPQDPDDRDRISFEPPKDGVPPAEGPGALAGPQAQGPRPGGARADGPERAGAGVDGGPSGADTTGASGPGAPPPPGPGSAGPSPAGDRYTGPGDRHAGPGDRDTGPPGSGDGPEGPWTQAWVRGRRLERRVDDRVVAGVAGGLGDAFGVDPAIFRLTFVALTFFGGGGLVLYALGWLFMPARDARDSIGESMLRRAGGPRSAGGIGLIVIAALIVVGSLSDIGGGLVWGVVMVIVGALVFRSDSLGGVPAPSAPGTRPPAGATTAADRTTAVPPTPPPARPTTSTDAPPPVDDAPTTDPYTSAAPVADAWSVGGPTTDQRYSTADVDPSSPPDLPPLIVDDGWRPRPLAPRPAPPPPPSILGRVTVAATLIAVGGLALLDNLTALDVAIASYAAVSLVIIGGGLLVGAFVGRARGLIPLGAVALVVVLVSAFVPELPVMPSGGTGERIHAPRTTAELEPSYEFGIGELVVDLGDLELEPGQDTEVDVTLGMGEMIVEVPPDVAVDVNATMRIGAIEALGRTSDGPAASTTFTEPGGEGAPTIDLDLVNGVGQITVRRAPEAN